MTAVLLAAGVAPPIIAAWAALERIVPLRARGAVARALSLALATIVGTGFASLLAYAWLVAGGTLGPGYAAFDSACFLAIAVLSWRKSAARREGSTETARAESVALALVALAIVFLAVAIVARSAVAPHGEWDAWAIWNHRARFLFRAGAQWRLAFADAGHPEYPLLLPLAVARLWSFAGETLFAPVVLACMFTVGTVIVVCGAVTLRSGAVAGAAAALLLTGTEAWTRQGASQYADVPLAALLACAATFLLAARDEPEREWHSLALAGACLGLAAWTKNEGLVLAAVFAVWTVAVGLNVGLGAGRLRAAGAWARAGALLAGAALPALARLHFQIAFAPEVVPEFTTNQTLGSMIARTVDPARWGVIIPAALKYLPGRSLPLPLVAAGVALLLGARLAEARRSPLIVPALAAWAAFLVAYASTPQPLDWHIRTSMARVLLQPWPTLLIGLLALVPPPDRAMGPHPAEAVRA